MLRGSKYIPGISVRTNITQKHITIKLNICSPAERQVEDINANN